ncbi:hypothetical protein GCM10009682_23020 [Luedemannella flava]|uniref:Serine aminopeptidase S33 domain-containing protein n=1 Tax=Luedemannella flava TaxID=349316 RepID=A0ABN2LW09_9ACTN
MKLAGRRVAAMVVACALAALAVAAVGAPWVARDAAHTETPAPQDSSLPGTAPLPEARCPGPGAPPVNRVPVGPVLSVQQLVLTTADGVNLAAVRVGGGERGVVLVHGDRGNLCTWWSFARRLAAKGFHVLAFDLRCYGFSECGRRRDYVADTVAAVTALRHAGAKRVALAGTALGANIALVTAAHREVTTGGVVAVSPVDLNTPVTDGTANSTVAQAAPRLGVPLLVCVGDAPAADLASLAAGVGNRQLVTGVNIGDDALAAQVTDFLTART